MITFISLNPPLSHGDNMSTYEKASKGLYYPYIHFRSDDWLMSNLLYWEGVKRIIPFEGFEPNDSETVRELVQAGLVEDVPASRYKTLATEQFLSKYNELFNMRNGNDPMGSSHVRDLVSQASDTLVHEEKMDHKLIKELEEIGDIQRTGPWLHLPTQIAGLYMMTLAGEASRNLNTPMLTDSRPLEMGSMYFNTIDGSIKPIPDGSVFARVMFPFPSQSQLSMVSVEDFMSFRDDKKDERRRFRQEMQAFPSEIEGMQSDEAVRDYLDDKEAKIESMMANHMDAMRQFQVMSAWDFMSISIPASAPAILGFLAAGAATGGIASVGFLTIGILRWYGKHRVEQQRIIESCPYHYLLSLKREFGTTNQSFNEFETGITDLMYD